MALFFKVCSLLLLFSPIALGQTALEKAAARNQTAAIAKLLLQGADLNGTDPDSLWERTPLIAAARAGSLKAVVLLLENGANPDLYDGAGSTALIQAIQRGHEMLAGTLLQHGAKTEIATDDGSNRTPLIWAILHKREAAVAALLKHGANPGVAFKPPFAEGEDKPALVIAQERSTPAIVDLIRQALAKNK